jgi:hypothetical protein
LILLDGNENAGVEKAKGETVSPRVLAHALETNFQKLENFSRNSASRKSDSYSLPDEAG